ncbi:MAG: SPOR domain-containing protein [Burkholderiaceae bacterium]|nr:SPOR domain-containing protein [Burkholderiaceae bacterium]HMN64371.1 SPOR domain-containing protein [Burkholderiaceae bacterium]
MAHPVVTARSRRMRGGTLLGFMIGLIVGLSIAVVVAIFVTRAPVPFVNKANRAPERAIEPKSQAEAPDPNAPLYSKSRPGPEPASPAAPAGSPPVAVAPPTAPPAAAPDAKGDDRATYLLQAGAFRSSSEAESMKAKLALIGFEARVLTADVNGQTMYRVRIGPYAQLDAMNRARARLAENGIEASVVRQR